MQGVRYLFRKPSGAWAILIAIAAVFAPRVGAIPLPAAAPPQFSVAAGTYIAAQAVTLTDATPGAQIYYTITGIARPLPAQLYSAPIPVALSETIYAVAVAPGYSFSATVSAAYTITPPASAPAFGSAPGTYNSTLALSISDSTPGAVIYYTLVGGAFTRPSTRYSGPINISSTVTVNAIALAPGYSSSPQASAAYNIVPLAPAPLITPSPGTYTSTQQVTLSDSLRGASIYYTADGTTPTTSSFRYSGPIAVPASATINAVAIASGYAPSPPSSASYTIAWTAAPPLFSPSPGTYIQAPAVTISDATPGAAIYFTTDGSAPSLVSTPYTGPVTLNSTSTLKAIAVAPGYMNWGQTSATYTITPPAAAPLITPAPGRYIGTQLAALSSATPGARIYYTTAGLPPTSSSSLCTNPIPVSFSQTIQAIAVAPGYSQSALSSAAFIIQGPLAVISPAALPAAFVGAPYAAVIAASGEGPAYAWTINGSPILPGAPPLSLGNGFSAASDGTYLLRISGKPVTSGPVSFIAGVTNPATGDQSPLVQMLIPITPPNSIVLPPANPNPFPPATTHGSYSAAISVAGGVPPYTWNVTGLNGSQSASMTVSTSTPISTVAGAGTPGFSGDGGPAMQAQIADHGGVAVDLLGNIYFADSASARVRVVSPSGTIATVVGAGKPGFSGDGGPAAQAQLNSPAGLAVDRAGNLYIADQGNSRIRMVSASTGIITTVAGSSASGFSGDGYAAVAAQLNHPAGVALDSLGNLYIADSGNARMRVVSAATGNIATVAGTGVVGFSGDNGPAALAQLGNPWALAIDSAGNVYIADLTSSAGGAATSGRIRKVTVATGAIATVAGSGAAGFNGDGLAAARAGLSNPVGLAIDQLGNLYIADAGNNRIRAVNPMAVISTLAGSAATSYNGDGIPASLANLNSPQSVAADPYGNLYIADGNARIRMVAAPSQNSNLILSGTPSAAGILPFQVSVTDSTGAAAGPVSYSIVVADPLPVAIPLPNPATLPAAVVGQPYTGSIVASGGVNNFTWWTNGAQVATANGIGGGFIATAGGNTLLIGGTPVAVGAITFRAWVKDGLGHLAGPVSYSIPVVKSPGVQVSGQINFVSCGAPAPGITLILNSNPAQIASTDLHGQFVFQNVPNGSFSITPSVAAPVSAFYPASQSVSVNGAAVAGVNFQSAAGYNVSGNVLYPAGVGGRVSVRLVNTSCPAPAYGANIAGATGFTIRGVEPGNYTVQAWVDEIGYGAYNAQDATASLSGLIVTSANLTNVSVPVVQPPPVPLNAPPQIVFAGGYGGGVILGYLPVLAGGVEQAAGYTVQWSATPNFASIAGSRNFTATGANGAVAWMINSLPSYSTYYFRAQGTTGNSAGPWSNVFGPVTVGVPQTGNTVSGTVTFPGAAKGPLYVGFRDLKTGKAYAQIILGAVSPQPYSIKVPAGANYAMFALLDQNGNCLTDAADVNGLGSAVPIAISANTTQNLVLPAGNQATVATQHFQIAGPNGPIDSYALSFDLPTASAVPLTVSLLSGPNVAAPFDLIGCMICLGQPLDFSVGLASTAPNPGDTYTLSIVDESSYVKPGWFSGPVISTASVTGVVNAFASGLSPATGSGAGATPAFSWADPPNASSYTYQFMLWDANGNVIWQIPGPGSASAGFSSAVTSISWGADPTGASNPPSVPALTPGATYTWSIAVQDAYGNFAESHVAFTP